MKSENKEYIIQIKQEMIVSRTILVPSFKDALDKADQLIRDNSELIKPIRGWNAEYSNEAEIHSIIG